MNLRVLSLAIALSPLAAWAQSDLNRTVAIVDGTRIAGPDYYRRMEHLDGFGALVAGKFSPLTPGFLTLQRLIDEAIMIQLAKDKGVGATDKDIDEEIAILRANDPNFDKNMSNLGFSEAEIRHDVEARLAEFNLVTMGINITDLEVEKFYKENPVFYTTPARYEVRIMGIADESRKAAVDEALKNGEKFEDVAKRLGQGTGMAAGDPIKLDELMMGEALKAAVKGKKAGETTDWFKGETSWLKVKVESVTESKLMPLDADLKKGIRLQLMRERGMTRNNLPAMMREARKKAKIQIPGSPYAKQLLQYYELGG